MTPSPLNRRRALGLVAGSTVAALLPAGGRASRGWCRVDPIFEVDLGQVQKTYHLWVAINAADLREARRLTTAPVKVVVILPPAVAVDRLDEAVGFGEGFDVQFKEDQRLKVVEGVVQMRIRVRVATSRRRRVAIDVEEMAGELAIPMKQAFGASNSWVELTIP